MKLSPALNMQAPSVPFSGFAIVPTPCLIRLSLSLSFSLQVCTSSLSIHRPPMQRWILSWKPLGKKKEKKERDIPSAVRKAGLSLSKQFFKFNVRNALGECTGIDDCATCSPNFFSLLNLHSFRDRVKDFLAPFLSPFFCLLLSFRRHFS